ncbi:MAG: hypothetical protein ACRD2E_08685 [Terriglobales bacterium]
MDPKKVFWTIFGLSSTAAGFAMPLLWSLLVTFPLFAVSWWLAYRSGWFC